MIMPGCGCKICKANLGEYVNDLIINNISPKNVLDLLKSKGLNVSEKVLKKHLSAFDIYIPEVVVDNESTQSPIAVDLNKIDFSEYDFDVEMPDSIVSYLQKINLKIYLNQTKITLKAQQDVIDGVVPDMGREVMQNLALAFQILDKSTGFGMIANERQAIKTVESLGLNINKNVQDKTESETE